MSTVATTTFLLFGQPRVAAGPGPAEALPETAPAYLGLFLAVQGGWVSREKLAAYLWPDAPADRGQHNLRVALNRLGALLARWGLDSRLEAERRRVRLDVPSDLTRFRATLASADWVGACALPTGPLLDGVQFTPYPALADWLNSEREALRRAWRKALFEAAAAGHAVADAAGRYLHEYATDADIVALQATQLAVAGRAVEAQDVIAAFKDAAQADLTTTELHASLRQIEHATAGVLGRAAAFAQPMLGRGDMLALLHAAVRSHRWVSVVGLPGAGKSTLLREWQAEHAQSMPRERCLRIDVTSASTVGAVTATIVDRLAAAVPRAGDVAERLRLAEGRLLLDGLDPAATDAELLALLRRLATHCPGLRVLVSARSPLGVEQEHVIRLQSLSIDSAAPGELSDAAALFVREAQRIRPLQTWADKRAAAERVARLSGGLPLALKLAAGWVRWLDPGDLAPELERSLSRSGSVLGDAVLAWLLPTWERLPSPQQQALAALSLFPGAFDMPAAMTVAAVPANVIEALTERCLVEFDAGTGPRLRMHALVRSFSAARLNEVPGRRREVIARFIGWVGERAGARGAAAEMRFDPGQLQGLLEELMTAWSTALETGSLADLSWLAAALLTWHEDRGEFQTGERHLAQALAALDETVPAETAILAHVQVARATLAYRAGDYDGAERLALEAQSLAEASAQHRLFRRASNVLGLCRWMLLRLDAAHAAFESGLRSAEHDGDRRGEAVFNGNLALVEKSRGNFAAAEARWRRVILLDEALGAWDGVCSTLNNLANLMRHQRRLAEAEELAQECLRLTRKHGLDTQRPFALIGLALLHDEAGSPALAEQYLGLLDACSEDTIEGPVAAATAQLRAKMALDRGDEGAALAHLGSALSVCMRNGDSANQAEALMLYGEWLERHANRRQDALALWAALIHAPSTQATLRAELARRFAALGEAVPPAAAMVDLTLVTEQAIAAATRRSAG